MRFTTYSKYHPELADAVNLQGLLDQLSDFLLQSGFAGNSPSFWHDDMGEGERSLEALRQMVSRGARTIDAQEDARFGADQADEDLPLWIRGS